MKNKAPGDPSARYISAAVNNKATLKQPKQPFSQPSSSEPSPGDSIKEDERVRPRQTARGKERERERETHTE